MHTRRASLINILTRIGYRRISMRRNKNKHCPVEDNIARARGPVQQPQAGPFPMAQTAATAITMPNFGGVPVQTNGMPMGLPVYTSVDEYGRTYSPLMHYGPQTHSAPVPVAIAPSVCQLNPIISPIAFVPYAGDDQVTNPTNEER